MHYKSLAVIVTILFASSGCLDSLDDSLSGGFWGDDCSKDTSDCPENPAPAFVLIDQHDETVNLSQFEGKIVVMTFVYTHCPDVCPLTLYQLAEANKKLAGAIDNLPRIILVSVDPDRDSNEVLKKYVNAFGENVIGITGNIEELKKLTDQLGIFFKANKHEGENNSVNHSAAVVVINEEAQFHAVFSAPHSIEQFVSDLPIIIKGS